MILVDENEEIEVPYRCPYCNAKLKYSCEGWEQDNEGRWMASNLMAHCQDEPEMGTEAWDDWEQTHYYEPYIHQLPVDVAAERWINERYRYRLEGGGG